MDLLTIRSRCKSRFRDLDNIFVTDVTWNQHINGAYREFYQAARWPFRLTSQDYVLDAGDRAIDLDLSSPGPGPTAAEVLEFISDVYDATGDRILEPAPGAPRLPKRLQIFFEQQDSTPLFYSISGDQLYVFPAPSGGSHTIRVWYSDADPAALADNSDVPDMPERYHEALVSGSLAKAHADDANHEATGVYRAEFERVLEQAFRELKPKGVTHDFLLDKEAERMRGMMAG